MFGDQVDNSKLGLFQDASFAGDMHDFQSTSGGVACKCGDRTFVSISWVCKKQTAVSHRSTEAEVISLDAGLRMEVLPALHFMWKCAVDVFSRASKAGGDSTRNHSHFEPPHSIHFVPPNIQNPNNRVQQSVFEDDEAVVKMIFKGRSSHMRHVARTHRVGLDWLFERDNWDSNISIRHVNTKGQIADIRTKGSFLLSGVI